MLVPSSILKMNESHNKLWEDLSCEEKVTRILIGICCWGMSFRLPQRELILGCPVMPILGGTCYSCIIHQKLSKMGLRKIDSNGAKDDNLWISCGKYLPHQREEIMNVFYEWLIKHPATIHLIDRFVDCR